MRVMDSIGYIGVFLLIALENIFPPIPSEVILAFGGFMTTYTRLQPFFVILCATAGALSGAIVLYFFGRLLGLNRIEKFTGKYGKFIRLKPADITKACAWYQKRENKAVFLCRMVPVLRSLISIPAGIAKMNFVSFLLLTALGSLIWNTALVFAGVLLGDNWLKITEFFGAYQIVVLVVLGLAAAALIIFLTVRSKKKSRKAKEAAVAEEKADKV